MSPSEVPAGLGRRRDDTLTRRPGGRNCRAGCSARGIRVMLAPMRTRAGEILTVLAVSVAVGEAQARPLTGSGPAPTPIFSGTEAEACAFPAVVSLDNGGSRCTGTLVHPKVVLYAAHCGAGDMQIGFGESAGAPVEVVTPSRCVTNPDYTGPGDEGADWAFCVLEEAVPVPAIPVAFGCELDLVESGATAVIVGFGEATEGAGDGPKRWAEAPIRLIFEDYVEVGGLTEPGVCAGDSGGPALIQAADGTWRTFGIASVHVDACGGIGHYAFAWNVASWVEAEAGIDITPCHEADGTWHPDFRCAGFAGADTAGVGAWGDGCAAAPRGDAGASCGAAFDASPDTTPPTVSITSATNTKSTPVTGEIAVEVDARDEGWGVARVTLSIGGAVAAVDEEPPFGFPAVTFDAGTWEIVAIAEDAVGLSTQSEPVTLQIGREEEFGGPDDCNCASGPASGWSLLPLVAWWFRPRRRAHP